MFLNVDGRIFTIPLDKASKKLFVADEIQRGLYKISPSGYGIHWLLKIEIKKIIYQHFPNLHFRQIPRKSPTVRSMVSSENYFPIIPVIHFLSLDLPLYL